MSNPFKNRNTFENVASGIVFAATTLLFVGTALAEFVSASLVV